LRVVDARPWRNRPCTVLMSSPPAG
jgi:hypothetical protein